MGESLEEAQAKMRKRMDRKFHKPRLAEQEAEKKEVDEIEEFFRRTDHLCPFCRTAKTRANKLTGELIPCKKCNSRRIALYKYGMSLREFFTMLRAQGGICAICRGHMKKVCVDHCHALGHVRGLLCGKCNTGLGAFDDDPEFLARAAKYVEYNRFRGNAVLPL